MDINPETLTTLGWQAEAAWAGAKLFGPTLDSIGQTLSRFTDYRLKNAENITRKAANRAGDILEEAGSIHPRVAHRLIEEGSYLNDDVMQEYVAGLLISDRRPRHKASDRAAYFINLIARLTASQVQIHHAVYASLAGTARQGRSLRNGMAPKTCTVIFRGSDALKMVSGSQKPREYRRSWPELTETLDTLRREGLIEDYAIGGSHAGFPVQGNQKLISVIPTITGAAIFMAAYGFPPVFPDTILSTPQTKFRAFNPPGPRFPSTIIGDITSVRSHVDDIIVPMSRTANNLYRERD
jgi:hypothetical protein